MPHIDFRSDTVTLPSGEMIAAMAVAKVGDDVKNEDPTVHELQNKVANLCQKDGALFVCSGTMSNQLAIRTHVTFLSAQREVISQQIILDVRSHVFIHELGGISYHSHASALPINPLHFGKPYLTAEIIEQHLFFGNDLHTPNTTIISLENTLGGQIMPIDEIRKIRALANKHQIKLHLDGARLWNASVATGIPLHEWASNFDSISLCTSKGLGAAVGSVLVGSREFIEKSKQYRKLFGGGWRQAGFLAAGSIYAIDHNWERMKDDHKNTKYLYHELLKLGFAMESPDTNMVFVNAKPLSLKWEEIVAEINKLQANETSKIFLDPEGDICRIVVHLQTPLEGIEKLLQFLKQALQNLRKD